MLWILFFFLLDTIVRTVHGIDKKNHLYNELELICLCKVSQSSQPDWKGFHSGWARDYCSSLQNMGCPSCNRWSMMFLLSLIPKCLNKNITYMKSFSNTHKSCITFPWNSIPNILFPIFKHQNFWSAALDTLSQPVLSNLDTYYQYWLAKTENSRYLVR